MKNVRRGYLLGASVAGGGIKLATPMSTTLQLPRDEAAPARARAAVDGLGEAIDCVACSNAQLLVSELVTNAVLYGAGDTVRLFLSPDGRGGLRCEVVDEGSGFVPVARPAHRQTGGWGLQLVERIADRWGVSRGSTHVWFELEPSAAASRARAAR